MIFIGADPGATGALAAIKEDRRIVALFDYPGDEIILTRSVEELLLDHPNEDFFAALEKVGTRPGQSAQSVLKFGVNYGIWKGVLAGLHISYEIVTPQKWQKGVIAKAEDKEPAMAAAGRMFPDAVIRGPRGGKIDGRADALLIADWCRRQYIVTELPPIKLMMERPRR